MTKQRIEYLDALKGFAIFLVIWGHCIQYLKKDIDVFQNTVFEFIYSFHMPLFFVISGFFFLSSLKLNLKDFLSKKFLQLLLPCLVWAIIYVGIQLTKDVILGKTIDSNVYLMKIINPLNWPFWFLKELFLSYILAYLSYRIFKKDWIVLLLITVLLLFAPFASLYYQRFLWPFFILGIYIKKNYSWIEKNSAKILSVSIIVFAILLYFWKGEYTIYKAGFPPVFDIRTETINFNFNDILIVLNRWLIGIVGSFSFFLLFKTIYKKNRLFSLLEKIGKLTLGIYIIQVFILEKELSRIVNFYFINEQLFNWIVAPAMALLILIVCYYIVKWINKNKYLVLFLLGTR